MVDFNELRRRRAKLENEPSEEQLGRKSVALLDDTGIVLDAQQQKVIEAVKRGRSVLVTGPAGTGKSQILAVLRKQFPIAVTATTGIAAVNVGGTTIHSWAGLGVTLDPEVIVQRMSKRVKETIRNVNYLAIDEISMFSDYQFDCLDWIFQYVRCNRQPFGGMTIVMFGDFLQLPPVSKGEMEVGWAFESEAWENLNPHIIVLEKIYRQVDPKFQALLNDLRIGKLSDDVVSTLASRLNLEDPEPDKPGVQLHCTNVDVDAENSKQLEKIDAKEHRSKADDWAVSDHLLERLDKDCRIPKMFRYKVGARVMLLANLDIEGGLANGTLGTITDINKDTGDPTILFDNGETATIAKNTIEIQSLKMVDGRPVQETIASRTQYPLRLAYAITIHKCVSGDTLVPTEIGIMRMDKLVEMGSLPRVAGLTSLKEANEPYAGTVEVGYRVTTKRGFSILCGERHQLMKLGEDGGNEWVRAPGISVGDRLRLRCGTGSFGNIDLLNGFAQNDAPCHQHYLLPSVMTPDLAWLLGALTGDGCVTYKDGRFDVTSIDDEISTEFSRIIRSIFGVGTKRISKKSNPKVSVTYAYNIGVRKFLAHIGLNYNKGRSKRVPYSVFQSPLESQEAFLRGLFDTDGGVNIGVHFTSSSLDLIRDVHTLLANLGIIGSIAVMRFPAWRINISGVDAKKFQERVNFTIPRKIEALKEVVARGERSLPRTHGGAYPKETGERLAQRIREALALQLVGKRKWKEYLNRILRGESSLFDRHLSAMCEELDVAQCRDESVINILSEANSGVFLDEVISIEREEAQMFDIAVPDGHDYIGNVFVNHNCQGLTLSKVYANIRDCFEDGQAYVALSRAKTLDGLFIKSSRRGCIRANRKAIKFYEKIRETSNS